MYQPKSKKQSAQVWKESNEFYSFMAAGVENLLPFVGATARFIVHDKILLF